jgi:hypothetical protein
MTMGLETVITSRARLDRQHDRPRPTTLGTPPAPRAGRATQCQVID